MAFVDWFGDGSVVVAELGFACCAAEFEAAAANRPRLSEAPAGSRVALVVSGTVTRATAPVLRSRVERLTAAGTRPAVIAFGACASAGGPYWDADVVTPADRVVDVAACVPGCAPTPDALTGALEALR